MVLESILAMVSGGATGLIGSLISDVTGHFAKKSKFAHDEKMAELDIKTLEAETAAAVIIAQTEQETSRIESAARIEEVDANAFIQAQKSDAEVIEAAAMAKDASTLLNVAAFTKTMIRPLLTFYLCIVSTMMYIDARNSLEGVNKKVVSAQTVKVYADTSNNVLYLTSAAVLFWFGQRKKK